VIGLFPGSGFFGRINDGAYLKIIGRQWKSIVENATGNAIIIGDEKME